MRFSQVSSKKDSNFDAVIKNISKLIKENSPEKLSVLNSSLKINSELVNTIGIDKFQCFFRNIDLEQYKYFIKTFKKLYNSERQLIISAFKSLPLHSFIDFIFFINQYQVSNFEDLNVALKVISKIGCGQSINNLLARSKSYVDCILGNNAFDEESKIKAILNATKPTVHINSIKHNNSFLNVDELGQATSCENDVSDEPPMLGLFYKDLQYIDNLSMDIFHEGKLLHCKNYTSNYFEDESIEKMHYNQDICIERTRDIKDNFKEKTVLKNDTDKSLKVLIKINILGSDIFESRAKLKCEEKEIELKEQKSHLNYKIKYPYLEPYNIDIALKEENTVQKPTIIDKTFIRYTVFIKPNTTKEINLSAIYKEQDIYEKTKENVKIPIKDFSHLGSIQNKVIQKASKDLNKLISSVVINEEKLYYISAGIPRYTSLFGRDSILSAYMLKDIQPNIARDTIKILAFHQGKSFEERFKQELYIINNSQMPVCSKVSAIKGLKELYEKREEEEGKIIHELRLGPLTQIAKTPHSPYYGSVDATALWVMLASEYYLKIKDESFYTELLPSIDKSINWILNNLNNGYLRFSGCGSARNVNIKNQGWKDADDSLKHFIGEDMKLKDPNYPVALAEVQAYIYKAFYSTSKAYQEIGLNTKAIELETIAKEIKKRFNTDFWCDRTGYYAIGLDSNNKKLESITSNIGHCLFSEIVSEEKKLIVENKLMSPEMFSGVGIRTLSSTEAAYDPLSYHNGSVWPHDSAICGLNMSKKNTKKIFDALCNATYKLPNMTVPEVLGGYKYSNLDNIECYPDTCSPQGWSSAGIVSLALKLT